MNSVVVSFRPRPVRGRHPIPLRRQVLERIEDFSMTATAEAGYSRDQLRLAARLLGQTPMRPDLAAAIINDVRARQRRIGEAGRALTAACEAEIVRPEVA